MSLERVAGKDVLLVKRFDREKEEGGWSRRPLVSALTVLGLDERWTHEATYPDLVDRIRVDGVAFRKDATELFGSKLSTGSLFSTIFVTFVFRKEPARRVSRSSSGCLVVEHLPEDVALGGDGCDRTSHARWPFGGKSDCDSATRSTNRRCAGRSRPA